MHVEGGGVHPALPWSKGGMLPGHMATRGWIQENRILRVSGFGVNRVGQSTISLIQPLSEATGACSRVPPIVADPSLRSQGEHGPLGGQPSPGPGTLSVPGCPSLEPAPDLQPAG